MHQMVNSPMLLLWMAIEVTLLLRFVILCLLYTMYVLARFLLKYALHAVI